MSRKTIGEDMLNQLDGSPIDLLTTPAMKNGATVKVPKTHATAKSVKKMKLKSNAQRNDASAPERQATQAKDRMTVQIHKSTIERVKDAVYWERLTVAQFVEEALEVALNKLEKQRGEPYQKRRSELKPGRPTK